MPETSAGRRGPFLVDFDADCPRGTQKRSPGRIRPGPVNCCTFYPFAPNFRPYFFPYPFTTPTPVHMSYPLFPVCPSHLPDAMSV